MLLLLAAACATSSTPAAQSIRPAAVGAPRPTLVPADRLYGAEEALRDVLSGELQYIGTGRWPGVERSRACAFRNQRVLIVNAYCTLNEVQAFRLDVYSPARGRVRIYAEANGAVSARQRPDYFSFMVESGQPPTAATRIPALTLTMSYEELRQYEQRRYDAFLPGCFGGVQNDRKVGGCLGALAPRASEWSTQNRAFIQNANADWYRVIRQMRSLATRYGVEPK
jgi:hypothetical protein